MAAHARDRSRIVAGGFDGTRQFSRELLRNSAVGARSGREWCRARDNLAQFSAHAQRIRPVGRSGDDNVETDG